MIITASAVAELPPITESRKYFTCTLCQGLTLEQRPTGFRLFDFYRNTKGTKSRILLANGASRAEIHQATKAIESRKALRASELNVIRRTSTIAYPEASVQQTPLQGLTDAYLSHHVSGLSASSQVLYRKMLGIYLSKFDSLEASTTRAIRMQLDDMRHTPVQANRFLSVVGSFLSWAFERGHVDTIASRGLKRYKEVPKSRNLDESELEVLAVGLEDAWCHSDIKLFVKIALATGARGCEITAMRQQDITGNQWIIPAAMTKNGREHMAYLPQELLDQMDTGGQGKVHKATSESTRQALKRIAVANSIAHFSNHDLRRTSGTLLARLGVDSDTRARWLNHSIGGVTARHYSVFDFAPQRLAASEELWVVLRKVGIL